MLSTGNKAVILWGPPGTGKTYESMEVVKELLKIDEIEEDKIDLEDSLMEVEDKESLEVTLGENETQTEEEAGKPTGNDGDKNSFITLLGLDKSIKEADTLAEDLEKRFKKFDEKLRGALEPLIMKYLYRHKR